jgi:hypothetical protein
VGTKHQSIGGIFQDMVGAKNVATEKDFNKNLLKTFLRSEDAN